MARYIEYCRTNGDNDTSASFAALDATVVEKCCLRRCGTCYTSQFLIVDGESRRGESHAALDVAFREENE